MAEKKKALPTASKPTYLQRLERSLDLEPYVSFVDQLVSGQNDDDSDSSDDCEPPQNPFEDDGSNADGVVIDKSRLYNFSNVAQDRKWLQDVLLESTESAESEPDEITEEQLVDMLKEHIHMKKYAKKYYTDPDNSQYQYYSAGLLSNYDKYPEHQKSVVGNKKRKREKDKRHEKAPAKKSSVKVKEVEEPQEESYLYNFDWEDEMTHFKEEYDDDFDLKNGIQMSASTSKRKTAQRNPEVMAARRRKLWIMMCKKEVGKVQRAKANNHKEVLAQCKKTAQLCMRHCRQKAMQSQKQMKETVWRMKRLAREMQAYWKRYDRVERETRRRMEKEAEEQRKMDVELIEAKRQQRKLNFLITQTELYAHFMSRKLGMASPEEQLRILNQLDEEKNPRLASIDDYDCEVMKAKAKRNAKEAFTSERVRTKQFDMQANSSMVTHETDDLDLSDPKSNVNEEEHPQPVLFKGNLKGYQLRGMNWLANLYDQGISGILADEMGLGKTVQSIAFLCHIAEKYSVWGPFLIISPASTLHNWQQEMARFVPTFKVVPYWGNPNERKILRQFWDQKDMHTKDASFHVVITSYQIVITDFKYFNRIKWQYMILDEAQAIKSTNSVRWKMLLGFSCRNRLLLSGTPIQNSMAELWALLHFIMPTLFDSHDEFNEWFSKDIESHAENKTGIDEKHLSRLHMILKPFMLRRIKKDVENELSDKIEIMVYCPLTTRQKLLYMALKKKIRIEDLLHYTISSGTESQSVDRNFTSNLMNLVMQFRKVCNHPELFERRDAKSPFFIEYPPFVVPKILYEEGHLRHSIPSKKHLLYNKLYIHTARYITNSWENDEGLSTFSFLRFLNISADDLYRIFVGDIFYRWKLCFQIQDFLNIIYLQRYWKSQDINNLYKLYIAIDAPVSPYSIRHSTVLQDLVFTAATERESLVYTYSDHVYHSMSETMEHRLIRSRAHYANQRRINKIEATEVDPTKAVRDPNVVPMIEEFPYVERPSRRFTMQRTSLPRFLFNVLPKVQCRTKVMYSNSRKSQWDWLKHCQMYSWQGLHYAWLQSTNIDNYEEIKNFVSIVTEAGGMAAASPIKSWSNIIVPDKETLVTDAGKLSVLDNLLKRLKEGGHRVLIYSQMTKMIDLLEEYMWHRKHKYMRLDGSSKISERRDMVADFQARTDIFVFLLSTRAGGLGINLTAADTVIFYDSDWNPTVDQQAMDRAHRLGQTKQVTVYRLICKNSIEERILQRAREKSEIQRMVISGGNFKPDTLKPKEVVSLLLDDEEIESKYRQRTEERRQMEEYREREREKERERKRKQVQLSKMKASEIKKPKVEIPEGIFEDVYLNAESCPASPTNSEILSDTSVAGGSNDDSSGENLVIDLDYPSTSFSMAFNAPYGSSGRNRNMGRGQSKRGRPRGSRRSTGRPGPPIVPGPSSMDVNDPSTSASSSWETAVSHLLTDLHQGSMPVRRGPGRPRLKPTGPGNHGSRGGSRPRKPARPLPVPLRAVSSTITAPIPSTSTSPFCFYEAVADQE